MKKIFGAIIATVLVIACNNSADSDKGTPIDADSFNAEEKKDLNNRNTTIYDSAQHGDTASYERRPGKVTDSVPH